MHVVQFQTVRKIQRERERKTRAITKVRAVGEQLEKAIADVDQASGSVDRALKQFSK